MVDSLNEIRAIKKKDQVEYTKDLYNKYLASIPKLDKENNDIFTTYRFLSIWLSNTYYTSLAYIQQRTGKYNYLMGRVRDLFFTETTYNYFMIADKDLPAEQNKQREQHYIDYYEPLSLVRYTKDSPREKTNREHIADALNLTLVSYKYLICYNKILDLLAEYYKIPDLDLFKYDSLEYIPAEYDHYNTYLQLLNAVLKNQQTTKELKDKKLELFNMIFKPIKYDFEIPKYKIDAVKEKMSMTNFNLFAKGNEDLINTLLF